MEPKKPWKTITLNNDGIQFQIAFKDEDAEIDFYTHYSSINELSKKLTEEFKYHRENRNKNK